MKKFILGLFLTFSIIVGAQTPSNNLNYVKLLKVPPVGQAKDSVLVFDSSDGYMKMRPQSTLSAAKATSVKSGTVKTDITQPDPIVYTKTTTDALLDIKAENSAGAISGFGITDNGNGTVTIASGFAFLRATNSDTGVLQKYSIPFTFLNTLVDGANNYVLADYNAGTPTLINTTNPTIINGKTNTIVYVIARVGTTLHYLNLSGANVDSNGKLRSRFLKSEAIKRAQGMAIGFANRNISVTAGVSHSGFIEVLTTAFNTATGSTFTNFYGTTRQTGQTQINNTQYNNAGVLTAMPNNSFRTDYVYVLANNPSKLYVIMGNTSATLTAARSVGTPSSLPVELQFLGILVGRTIIAKDATAITEVSSAFETVFANNGVTNYSDLAGLPTIDQTLIDGSTNAVSGNAVFDGLAGKLNTPTGLTTNYLPKWNGSGFGNSQVFDNGTNVGINTNNPSENLDVAGNIKSNSIIKVFGVGGVNSGLGTIHLNNGIDTKTWALTTGIPSAYQEGFSIRNLTDNTTLLYIKDNGNVGIGVVNPTSKLEVNGNITASPAVAPNQVVVKSQLDAVGRPYKVYTALISQTGTNAPVATVLENTLGGTVVWTRTSTGLYVGTLNGAFTVDKTSIILNGGNTPSVIAKSLTNINTVTVYTTNASGAYLDAELSKATIEIRVYN